jgi:hypothetical protein
VRIVFVVKGADGINIALAKESNYKSNDKYTGKVFVLDKTLYPKMIEDTSKPKPKGQKGKRKAVQGGEEDVPPGEDEEEEDHWDGIKLIRK